MQHWSQFEQGRQLGGGLVSPDRPRPSDTFDPQRPRTADGVLEQFERHPVADGQIVERRPLAQVASMEEHLASARQPDEAVPLSEHERDDAARARRAAAFGWAGGGFAHLWHSDISPL